MTDHKIYSMRVASVYPLYLAKVTKKGKTAAELDQIISWLTGYSPTEMMQSIDAGATFREFFANAPAQNPNRKLITGLICGIRVEEIADPLMQEIRYLDKLVDELARGKKMQSILRA